MHDKAYFTSVHFLIYVTLNIPLMHKYVPY